MSLLSSSLLLVFASSVWLHAAGPSVSFNDPELRLWAGSVESITYGANVTSGFQTPAKALGPASGNLFDIMSLGEGGRVTLNFPGGLADGPGWDFAVFENAFGGDFLELAFVEVSSDGVHWLRFPTRSETTDPVGAFGTLEPELLDGFAGLHPIGQGTVFDLETLRSLPNANLLDFNRIRHIRLLDVAGDGRETDSSGRPVYDPFPTQGSAGFDLEALGARYPAAPEGLVSAPTVTAGNLGLSWTAVAGARYRVETSVDLVTWNTFQTVEVSTEETASLNVPMGENTKIFARVVRER